MGQSVLTGKNIETYLIESSEVQKITFGRKSLNGRSYKMRNKNFKEEKGTFERRKRYICEKERVHY